MRNIIYNTQTKTLSKIFENGYNVPIPEHEKPYIFVLDVVEQSKPTLADRQTITSSWKIDLKNKTYTKTYEVIDLPPLTNEDIQQLRQQAYSDESDSLYMAYKKYEEQGRLEDAQIARTKWLEKIDEINLRYPYNE